jgi:peptidoglycan/xylan/chitin deacetylase (PgdA/CDA1 family)
MTGMSIDRFTVKRVGRPIVARVAFYAGYCTMRELLGRNKGLRILAYHGINDDPDNPYALAPSVFEQHMALLRSGGYHVAPLTTLLNSLGESDGSASQSVAVTLDDGYLDAFTNAFPILTHYDIPATLFLPTGYVGTGHNPEARGLMSQDVFLSWNQVCEMSAAGIEFGSHTVSHRSLAVLEVEELEQELRVSKETIEDQIGASVSVVAYPYGTVRAHSEEVWRIAALTGYSHGLTVMNGVNRPRDNPFALRRTMLEGTDSAGIFAKILTGALDPWAVVDRLGRFLPSEP